MYACIHLYDHYIKEYMLEVCIEYCMFKNIQYKLQHVLFYVMVILTVKTQARASQARITFIDTIPLFVLYEKMAYMQ